MGVDAERESRVCVAEVFGRLFDGDAAGEHGAGVVVPELVDSFPAGREVASTAAAVLLRLGDDPGPGGGGFPGGF